MKDYYSLKRRAKLALKKIDWILDNRDIPEQLLKDIQGVK